MQDVHLTLGIGLQAFFNGGILSNDASTPVNGSAFEVLDLRTMSPLVVQVPLSRPQVYVRMYSSNSNR